MKKVYILIVGFGIIIAFVAFRTFVKIKQHNYVTMVLNSNLKYSNILEEELCKISKVYPANKEWFKKYDDNLYFKNFIILCDNDDIYTIKVLVKNSAFQVYAYEIDGEIINEENLNIKTE